MKENVNKYLDNLSIKVITSSSIESPSFNFTDSVMSQVTSLNQKQTTVYKPLLSNTTWSLIFIGVVAIIIYVLFSGNQSESTSWLSTMNFEVLSNNRFSNLLSSFKISKTLMYAVVFLGIMICIQVPILKNHFDKRFKI
ncbi:MAG: hypothetical protein HKO01_05805 [Flaviramulus sp.]|nr:hypothetical protein [Flaviramulus sp.]NNC50034.1 hypothetical protein [Flaviramulus sp.]